jgi:hypothetical protein
MQPRKLHYLIPILAGLSVFASLFLLWPAEDVSAQCGSQASSCKNCHEVQGQDPVNDDGTGWHVSHAFGDFCYICHAGNNQSMDQDEAHAGMVPPLSDIQAGCASCHPADLAERAGVYAATLGIEVGTGGGGNTPSQTSGSQDDPSVTGESSSPSAPPAMVVDAAEVIDFNQRYAETVLGQRQVNWGNVIVSLMIAMVAVGGGGFVYWNERRQRGLPLVPAKLRPTPTVAPEMALHLEGFSDEVAALLPGIASLNPIGLHALKKLLENPDEASALLHSLSRLDPDLVRGVRNLDRESKALLLALSGD